MSGAAGEPADRARLAQTVEGDAQNSLVLAWPATKPTRFCLIVAGNPHCALRMGEDHFEPLSLRDYFGPFRGDESTDFALHGVDPLVALTIAALSRGEATTLIPIEISDAEALVAILERDQKSALIVIDRADGRTLGFVQRGSVARTLAHDAQAFEGPDARDRLLEPLVLPGGAGGNVAVYENPVMARDPLGGLPMERYYEATLEPYPLSLQISLGGRAVTRRMHASGRLVVGRSGGCDLSVDDVSVSREHLAIEWQTDHWQVSDLHSSDGIFLDGERVAEALLRPGDEVTFGRAKMRVSDPVRDGVRTMRFGAQQLQHQTGVQPHLIIDTSANRVDRPVFSVGGASGCDFVVPSWPDEVGVIVLEEDDLTFNCAPIVERLVVNGEQMMERGFVLRSGDLLEIGNRRVLFVMMEPAPSEDGANRAPDISSVLQAYLENS